MKKRKTDPKVRIAQLDLSNTSIAESFFILAFESITFVV